MFVLSLITTVVSLGIIAISILVLIKVNKNCEKYDGNLKGSITCAYAMGGGNTAYCNDWLRSARSGKLCQTDDGCTPDLRAQVCCKDALKCCNQINTCGGGKSCSESLYAPTLSNNLMYDHDVIGDE